MNRERELAETFVQLADTLVDDYDVADLLHELVLRCVQLLDASAAGLLLSDQRGSLQVMASSTERTRLLELFQLQTQEGPCLDCFTSRQPVLVPDLTETAHRWPLFSEQARQEGYQSVHAFPLRLRDQTIGALNLFGHEPGEMPADNQKIARALADVATIGILQERALRRSEVLTEQLQTALNSRVVIEQAKGVLAERGNVDVNTAFTALRGHARAHGLRLGATALDLVEGRLDPDLVLAGAHQTR
ncbi:GAF and ANTAR domain-containing protein [Streptomyces sp. N2-109]|uniref:GAF and ANTAR domain-containing protein n=2 Tax=Streptomyces gossypii TaxID=2883101 RepID=A0ABT2JUU0_9ACTN|nr:GAF and ANTAR domain-containing protein [Streptomyces gossypii]